MLPNDLTGAYQEYANYMGGLAGGLGNLVPSGLSGISDLLKGGSFFSQPVQGYLNQAAQSAKLSMEDELPAVREMYSMAGAPLGASMRMEDDARRRLGEHIADITSQTGYNLFNQDRQYQASMAPWLMGAAGEAAGKIPSSLSELFGQYQGALYTPMQMAIAMMGQIPYEASAYSTPSSSGPQNFMSSFVNLLPYMGGFDWGSGGGGEVFGAGLEGPGIV